MSTEEKKLQEAFAKVKKDIFNLQSQILSLTREIHNFKRTFMQTDKPTDRQTPSALPQAATEKQTEVPLIQTNPSFQQTFPASKMPEKELKTTKTSVSTGNEGVPTDRQTNQQTDKSAPKFAQPTNLSSLASTNPADFTASPRPYSLEKSDKITRMIQVSEVVNSLDVLKKDIRSLFKKLTSQEMLVYSKIYQLSDQGFVVDYSLLASKTSLTESSIRDYVLKLQKKGVPLSKSKENNKKVILTIPSDFKKIASLSTIISLREL
jgi:hypothetical protein